MSRRTWSNRLGVVSLILSVRVRSSGWDDPGRAGGPPEDCREPEREEERGIVAVELGSVTVNAEDGRFVALVDILQEQVDGTDELDVDWEEDD